MGATKEVTVYRLTVAGVFGRNRKRKVEGFDLKEVARTEQLSSADVHALALAKVTELKVKPGARLVVSASDERLEEWVTHDGIAMVSRLVAYGSARRLFDEVLVPL